MSEVPFTKNGDGRIRLNGTRVFEGIVIAALTAMASGYVTLRVIESELAHMQKDINDNKTWILKFRDDFYAPRYPHD